MNCPNCGSEILLDTAVLYNVGNYQQSAIAKTYCCKTLVRVSPRMTYKLESYDGDKTMDDWGNKVEKPKDTQT